MDCLTIVSNDSQHPAAQAGHAESALDASRDHRLRGVCLSVCLRWAGLGWVVVGLGWVGLVGLDWAVLPVRIYFSGETMCC